MHIPAYKHCVQSNVTFTIFIMILNHLESAVCDSNLYICLKERNLELRYTTSVIVIYTIYTR